MTWVLRDPGIYWAPVMCQSLCLAHLGADAFKEPSFVKVSVLSLTFIMGRELLRQWAKNKHLRYRK